VKDVSFVWQDNRRWKAVRTQSWIRVDKVSNDAGNQQTHSWTCRTCGSYGSPQWSGELMLSYCTLRRILINQSMLVGWREGHPACKKSWMLDCWWWQFDWSFAQLIAPVVTFTSIILSVSKTS